METPLEIAFHNLTPSPAVEENIRERVAKLEKMYPRMTGCRVAVQAPHKQHRTGNIYEVHIEMLVPGAKLVVSREPHRAKQKYAHPDVYASVREAFAAAETQLKDYKEQQRGDVKNHPPTEILPMSRTGIGADTE
jgi:ribosome-associated translation inhibitor RaiA